MWTDIHVERILRISGNSKNLDTVGINEKNFSLERLVDTSMIRLDKIIFLLQKTKLDSSTFIIRCKSNTIL